VQRQRQRREEQLYVAVLAAVILWCGWRYVHGGEVPTATVVRAWPAAEARTVTVGIKYGLPQTYHGVTLVVHDVARGVFVLWSHAGKLDEIPAGNYTGVLRFEP
jgi:hypothetical protein